MISLCVICGNESAHIERMLASFAPAFEELSLVRAIGTAEPDDTVARAETWCAANGKAFRFADYKNASDLAHVDDFAAARNQSFAQASGDWLLWADCDDVCDNASLIPLVAKEAARRGEVMVRFPYAVPESGGKVAQRERLVRADLFRAGRKWHWPVHENFLIAEADKYAVADGPTWTHAPTGPKAGGTERNLRILRNAVADAPANYYYIHQEQYYLGNHREAERYGRLFVDMPGAPDVLRYQAFLHLAELSDSKEQSATYALRAHHLFPRHKEAIAALCRCAFQEENADRALHWSSILYTAREMPVSERLWFYEPKWDKWGKFDYRARALRLAGLDTQAAKIEAYGRSGLSPRIALLHATRGRAQRAIACRERWLDSADRPELVEHIFGIDADDRESLRWLKSFRHVIAPQSTCVAAWNECAAASEADLLVQLSDDWLPVRGWDSRLLGECGHKDAQREPFVVAVGDGHRTDQLLCMAILSRARWEQQGREMFAPEYESVFSDNEFSFRAWRDGVVIDARSRLTFQHAHPAFGQGAMDDTYRRQNAPEKYQRGEATFRKRNPDAL